MKILAVVSALDLRLSFGATSAWWQLFKALHESGTDVIATPYAGDAVASPWWRVYPNPCRAEGRAFLAANALTRRLARRSGGRGLGLAARTLLSARVRPRWRRHLATILERETDVAAVVVINVPVNHFTGVASFLRSRFALPVLYLDGDMPMSLPAFGGYASGVRGYDGADLGEYDAFVTNSRGAEDELRALGARRTHTLHFAADPALFAPWPAERDIDVFFYAYGAEQREDAIRHMVSEPSREMPESRFVVGGARLGVDLGAAHYAGVVPTEGLSRHCARAHLNLNIVRRPHARYYASSCMRLFELAAMGCCIVSNPMNGLEEWFEPGREVVLAPEGAPAAEIYRRLLADPAERRAIAAAARARVGAEHTYHHRAGTFRALLGALGARA